MYKRITIGAGVLALALAAGCGNGSSGRPATARGDVLHVIRAAASATAEQRSMRVRGTMTMDLGAITGAGGGSVSTRLTGVMQTKPLLARMTMSGMSVAGQSVGDVTALMTPDAFYLNMPMLTRQTGKPWVEIKFSDMKAQTGFDVKQLLAQSQQMQPAQYVKQLAASGDVRAVGSATVDGTHTTHYVGTVSVPEQLSHFSGAVRSQMQTVIGKTGWTGAKIDVWLDSKGLVRRMRSASVGGRGSMTIDFDVLAYGISVHVSPPPAGQVVDLGRFAGGAAR